MLNLTEQRRAWIYRVLVALAPLAVLYGIATDNAVSQWLAVAAAILGPGLAVAHTSTSANSGTSHQ